MYTPKGEIIELPKGSTPIDFAYRIHTDIGNSMIGAIVNNENVSPGYELQNKDRVRIITSEYRKAPSEEWSNKTKTTRAKRKIREFNKK